MYAMERQQEIRHTLGRDGRVSVLELAKRFGVTPETVRRDLDLLEGTGAARRVHGGAVLPDRVSTDETSVRERAETAGGAKRAIARRAIELIPPGFRGSVLVDAGTTTRLVAAGLPGRLSGTAVVDVVTHAMPIAADLASADGIRLTVIGGRVRGLTGAAVGADAVRAVQGLRPDLAFVGTNGISAGFGLSTPDPDEAAMKSALVDAARKVVVVADASKLDREMLVSFAPLDAVDVLVTDTAPPDDLAAALDAAGVEVILP